MKCSEAQAFLSQIAYKALFPTQIQQSDLDYLSTNGYITLMTKEEYDQAAVEVSNLTRLNEEMQSLKTEAAGSESELLHDEKKTHSILFHFEGEEKKEVELGKEKSESEAVSEEEAGISMRDSLIAELIQKKSTIDRMVQYGNLYVALTGLGVLTLNDLKVRNYRVADDDFTNFVDESMQTSRELRGIAERGNSYVKSIENALPKADSSQLWSVSIGLAKLQGDQSQLINRFVKALDYLQHFKSNTENKMMAAEILTSFVDPSHLSADNSDLMALSENLQSLDHTLRQKAKVPDELSAGIAALIMFGKRYDGTYPIDRFMEFYKTTSSYESAAILSVFYVPSDQMEYEKFLSFRSLFNSWGYTSSEDTELASAYLTVSDLGPEDVKTKLSIIIEAVKNYLEYPLVASSILASIPTLEANETLDLAEKAYSLVASYATDLQRSELLTLAVRMIHGIKNELIEEIDPSATIANTPVQFTHAPLPIFFMYRAPLLVAHSSYYSTFSGIGGAHPAHVHSVGGFSG